MSVRQEMHEDRGVTGSFRGCFSSRMNFVAAAVVFTKKRFRVFGKRKLHVQRFSAGSRAQTAMAGVVFGPEMRALPSPWRRRGRCGRMSGILVGRGREGRGLILSTREGRRRTSAEGAASENRRKEPRWLSPERKAGGRAVRGARDSAGALRFPEYG